MCINWGPFPENIQTFYQGDHPRIVILASTSVSVHKGIVVYERIQI